MKFTIIAFLLAGFSALFISQNSNSPFANADKEVEIGEFVKEYDFGAKLYNSTHGDIDSFLDAIKLKYKGKAVILDLWGTFCKPCLEDFANSSEIKKELKNIDVHMVYLCAARSSKIPAWFDVIEKNEMEGDHIWMAPNLTTDYMQKYGIKRYPNYILIDKEGNLKQHIIRGVARINPENFKAYL